MATQAQTSKLLPSNASKVQEIAYLDQVVTNIGEQTYLASLFSPAMVEWVTYQIKQDLSCDLYEVMTFTKRDAVQASADASKIERAQLHEINRLQIALASAEARVKETEERTSKTVQGLVATLDARNADVKNLVTQCNAVENKLAKVRQEALNAWADRKLVTPEALRDILAS